MTRTVTGSASVSGLATERVSKNNPVPSTSPLVANGAIAAPSTHAAPATLACTKINAAVTGRLKEQTWPSGYKAIYEYTTASTEWTAGHLLRVRGVTIEGEIVEIGSGALDAPVAVTYAKAFGTEVSP